MRGTMERLAPVLMTALSAGLALTPLLFGAGEAGREILHPVAVTIFGGLLSATILDTVLTPVLFLTFGNKPLARLLASHSRKLEPSEAYRKLHDELNRHANSVRQPDDILQILPRPEGRSDPAAAGPMATHRGIRGTEQFSRDGEVYYCVKSPQEPYDRVVTESQLRAVSVN